MTDPASVSRFVIVANCFLSRSKQAIKIVNLQGQFIGIAKRDEILDLFDGYRDHVNIVVYCCDPKQGPLELKSADPEKIRQEA